MYNDLQKNCLYRYICKIVNCTLYIVNWFDKLLFSKHFFSYGLCSDFVSFIA